MILFTDNDIFLKLSGCDLLYEFLDCLSLTGEQICVAPDLKFSIQGQMKKSFYGENAEQAKNTLNDFLSRVKVSNELVSAAELDLLSVLMDVPKIDSGEAILLTHAYFDRNSKIATGDKNCLKALMTANNLQALQVALQGRIYTLEMIMIILISRLGFDVVNQKVIHRCVNDTVLQIAFGEHKSQNNAIEGLSYYTKDFLDLLVEPSLIVV